MKLRRSCCLIQRKAGSIVGGTVPDQRPEPVVRDATSDQRAGSERKCAVAEATTTPTTIFQQQLYQIQIAADLWSARRSDSGETGTERVDRSIDWLMRPAPPARLECESAVHMALQIQHRVLDSTARVFPTSAKFRNARPTIEDLVERRVGLTRREPTIATLFNGAQRLPSADTRHSEFCPTS